MSLIAINGKMQSGKDLVARGIVWLNTQDSRDPKDLLAYFKSQENLKTDIQIAKFATKLKIIASLLLGIPVEDFEKEEVKSSILPKEWWYYTYGTYGLGRLPYLTFDADIEEKYLVKMTVREFLQDLGTEALREGLHPNVHVNALFSNYSEESSKWIITDLRFFNELGAVEDRQGTTIKVERSIKNRYPSIWREFCNSGSYPTTADQFMVWASKAYPGFYRKISHKSETTLDEKFTPDLLIKNNGSLLDLAKTLIKYERILTSL